MDAKSKIGVVERVTTSLTLYRVRVFVDDDQGETENVYFDTKFSAERFVKGLPESTR